MQAIVLEYLFSHGTLLVEKLLRITSDNVVCFADTAHSRFNSLLYNTRFV